VTAFFFTFFYQIIFTAPFRLPALSLKGKNEEQNFEFHFKLLTLTNLERSYKYE